MDELALLGKPDTSLLEHTRGVVEQGKQLIKLLNLSPDLERRVLLACAFHDIGKATHSFQHHMKGKRGRAYPHALASFPFTLLAEGMCLNPPLLATAAVISHHSPLTARVYKGYEEGKGPDYVGEEILIKLLERIAKLLNDEDFLHGLPLDFGKKLWEHLKKMGNNPAALLEEKFYFGEEEKSLRGIFRQLSPQEFSDVKTALQLADWVASSKKFQSTDLFLRDGRNSVIDNIKKKGLMLKFFQKKAKEIKERRLWLRAPTGTGKTEALLLWAGDAQRLIYLLPTQATANAMWQRLKSIYGDQNVGLVHGRAGYILRKELEEGALDEKLWAGVFAKPVVVGTLDQYLFAHLHGRHWEIRRALARRATVILDEIHSYDPYTLGLLAEALTKEMPARIAFASATLPDFLSGILGEGPLLEAEDTLWQRQRHRIELREGHLEDALDEIVSFAEKGKSVLVILNTVKKAQEIYKALKGRGNYKLHLLHSRFIFKDRWEKENKLESSGKGSILISTQIVEVSLDISYDVLFTQIAPIDALVQRLGRVNRRGITSQGKPAPPAPVFIFLERDKGSERIYGAEILSESERILRGLSQMPTDREWVKATNSLYNVLISTPSYQEDLEKGRKTLKEIQQILGCYTIDLSDEEMQKRFITREGQLSIEVLPRNFKDEVFALKESGQLWRIVEFLVPVPIYWLHAFKGWFSPAEDLGVFLTDMPYSSEIGLVPPMEKDEAPLGAEMY